MCSKPICDTFSHIADLCQSITKHSTARRGMDIKAIEQRNPKSSNWPSYCKESNVWMFDLLHQFPFTCSGWVFLLSSTTVDLSEFAALLIFWAHADEEEDVPPFQMAENSFRFTQQKSSKLSCLFKGHFRWGSKVRSNEIEQSYWLSAIYWTPRL
jgi:hypothetical protein